MVRLSKDKLKGGSESKKKQGSSTDSNIIQNSNEELEKFSLQVLKFMTNEGVPSTPSNFQVYFEKLLESKPIAFKKRIKEYLDDDKIDADEYRAKLEKEIKEGFIQVKEIVKVVSTIYKNLNIMKKIFKKRSDELKSNSSQLSIDSTLGKLNDDIEKLTLLTQRQMNTLKEHYSKTVDILKNVEEKAVFDSKYSVYNKKYFLYALEKELDAIKLYSHKSSIVLIKVKDKVLDKMVTVKEREALRRNIAKLLMKTSRRSDIVAHYGSGIFAVLMRHTDLDNAKKASERIAELIYGTSFFIGEMEVEMDIELGIMPIDAEYNTEEIVVAALDVLPKTGKDKDLYLVGEFDERDN